MKRTLMRELLRLKVIDLHEMLRFLVESESDPEVSYMVDLLEWKCSCPDSAIAKQECKHMLAATIHLAKQWLNDIRTKTKQHEEETKAQQRDDQPVPERVDRGGRVRNRGVQPSQRNKRVLRKVGR